MSSSGARVVLSVLVALTLAACGPPPSAPASWTKQDKVFGDIPATLTVYGPPNEAAFRGFIDRMNQIDREMSMWDRPYTTDIMRLAAASGTGRPVEVSDDTMTVLRKALEVGAATEGALDVTVGPLVKLWGVYTDHPKVPTPAEIAALLPLTELSDLVLEGKTAYLKKKGMIVDVGGIAKGFAADRAVAYLKTQGITSAIVDLGGNVYAMGSKPDGRGGGKPWRIGIQDPFQERGNVLGTVSAVDTSLVTSGVYERKFTDPATGKTYHHILDPKTGYPSESGVVSVTIVNPSSITCDAFAKVLVLGLNEGWKVLEDHHLEGIFVTGDKKVYVTPGLAKDFSLKAGGYQLVDHP